LYAVAFTRWEEDIDQADEMATKFCQRYSAIANLKDISPEEIHDMSGLEGFEILRAQALMELGRRAGVGTVGDLDVVENYEDVVKLLSHLQGVKQEHFCVIFLDAKNQVMRYSDIHKGTLTMSPVGPREVFREAIREGASSIIVAHNHPSGDPEPSPEDIDVTSKLVEVGKLLDIPLLDHVIIGSGRKAVSLKRRGYIK
jgi:DNA repair protein RadC